VPTVHVFRPQMFHVGERRSRLSTLVRPLGVSDRSLEFAKLDKICGLIVRYITLYINYLAVVAKRNRTMSRRGILACTDLGEVVFLKVR